MSPWVRAAATMNVPASIRSGMISWLGPAELVHAGDPDDGLADPVDLRPHLDQELAQAADLGLPGAVAEDGLAAGPARRP